MGYFKTRGLRGSGFEDLINETNREYLSDGLAVIQKIPTPITPVEMSSDRSVITLAYFDKQSTVDYIGNVQGIPVCFDAKETKGKSLSVSNIRRHQMEFMNSFAEQDGVAFILVSFIDYERYFVMDIAELDRWWNEAERGGRKSIPMEAFDESLSVERDRRYLVHYLPAVQAILDKKTATEETIHAF
ncbi:MAG: Holliday junction resolvase RecU [Eubacteriaceae bacterium]|nr:Holliday junction resolvase RecU [Eubacteriaceae bacterium]